MVLAILGEAVDDLHEVPSAVCQTVSDEFLFAIELHEVGRQRIAHQAHSVEVGVASLDVTDRPE